MPKKHFSKYRILIMSENPDKLMKFYRDVLDLELLEKVDIINDYGYMLKVHGDTLLWIGKHSEVKGYNQDPVRHIFNLYPKESVEHWYKKVKDISGVKILCKPELTPFATKDDPTYVATFLDPEGNCWQFMGPK